VEYTLAFLKKELLLFCPTKFHQIEQSRLILRTKENPVCTYINIANMDSEGVSWNVKNSWSLLFQTLFWYSHFRNTLKSAICFQMIANWSLILVVSSGLKKNKQFRRGRILIRPCIVLQFGRRNVYCTHIESARCKHTLNLYHVLLRIGLKLGTLTSIGTWTATDLKITYE
jgi:hypothetical protein